MLTTEKAGNDLLSHTVWRGRPRPRTVGCGRAAGPGYMHNIPCSSVTDNYYLAG